MAGEAFRFPYSSRGWSKTINLNSMQRIRIGLTGLAFVFLLVLLGTAISRPGDDGMTNNLAAPTNIAEPNEPLAELGVAPGQGSTNTLVPDPGNAN